MHREVNESKKFVLLYLSNEEQANPHTQEKVKAQLRENKASGLQTVIFYSGALSLAEQTSALLCGNRRRIPEQERTKKRRS